MNFRKRYPPRVEVLSFAEVEFRTEVYPSHNFYYNVLSLKHLAEFCRTCRDLKSTSAKLNIIPLWGVLRGFCRS